MARTDGLRVLILKYLLYDALLRPGAWAQALLNDRERAASWLRALLSLLGSDRASTSSPPAAAAEAGQREEDGGDCGSCVAFLSSAGAELPLLPLALGLALGDRRRGPQSPAGAARGAPPVVLVEPVKPLASAVLSCVDDNDLSEQVAVVSELADVRGTVSLVVSTAAEDVSTLPAALDGIREALDALGSPAAAPAEVAPSHVQLRALLLHIPPGQAVPVRSDVATISGFDLRLFNRFRQSSLSDSMRLADVKHQRLSGDLELATLATRATRGSEDLAGAMAADSRAESSGLCNAVALWVEPSCTARLAAAQEEGSVETLRLPSPGPSSRSRRQLLCHLPAPVALEAGSRFRLGVSYDASSSSFRAAVSRPDDLPVEAGPPEEDLPPGGTVVERWHFGMVNDWRRNGAYDTAICEAVRRLAGDGREVLVLDIGAGSGLLSMMAARASPAARVTAVERVAQLAACASEIAVANGLERQVAVVHGESTDLGPEDLEGRERADLLVSEILDDGLLGEGVIPTVAHARRELLRPGAQVIPAFASIWAVVIECPMQPEPVPIPAGASLTGIGGGGASDPLLRLCNSLDLGAFDVFHPTQQSKYHSVRLDRLQHRRLCRPVRVFDFDFQRPLDDPASGPDFARTEELVLEATAGGTANAVAFWFTAKLLHDPAADGPPEELCAAPGWADICSYPAEAEACGAKQGTRCWTQAINFLAKPCQVEECCRLSLQARHGPSRVSFKLSSSSAGPSAPR